MGKEKPNMGKLALWGWKFWKNILQVIHGSPQDFQLMACCRLQVRMLDGDIGRAGITGVR